MNRRSLLPNPAASVTPAKLSAAVRQGEATGGLSEKARLVKKTFPASDVAVCSVSSVHEIMPAGVDAKGVACAAGQVALPLGSPRKIIRFDSDPPRPVGDLTVAVRMAERERWLSASLRRILLQSEWSLRTAVLCVSFGNVNGYEGLEDRFLAVVVPAALTNQPAAGETSTSSVEEMPQVRLVRQTTFLSLEKFGSAVHDAIAPSPAAHSPGWALANSQGDRHRRPGLDPVCVAIVDGSASALACVSRVAHACGTRRLDSDKPWMDCDVACVLIQYRLGEQPGRDDKAPQAKKHRTEKTALLSADSSTFEASLSTFDAIINV